MKPPKHLSPASRSYWRHVATQYEITPDAAILLQAALENWDQAQAARMLVASEGLVLDGKRHPAIDISKQAYSLFHRFMRQLGPDLASGAPVGRPDGAGMP